MVNKKSIMVTVIALAMVLVFVGCSKKAEAQSNSGDSGSAGGSARTAELPSTPESDFTVVLTQDSAGVIINKYNGTAAVVNIPSTIQGLPVRELNNSSFINNRTITSIVISEGVTRLGTQTFSSCINLTSVTLPSTLTSIGISSFQGTGLTSFPNSWPVGITTIERSTFENTNLRELVIPEGITTINVFAFGNCNDLVSVTLPSTIISISDSAFQGSRNINLASQAAIKAINLNARF